MKKVRQTIGILIIIIMIWSITSVCYAAKGGRVSGGRVSTSKSTSSSASKSISSSTSKSTSKYNSSNIKTEKINDNPTYYKNYSSTNMFTPNAWTALWMFQCLNNNTEQVSEQDIAKELEERGYTQEEINEILNEGRMAQEEDKQNEEYDPSLWIFLGLLLCIFIFAFVMIVSWP